MDCSPRGSSLHRILRARILEWVAMPSSRGSSRPRDQTCVSCLLHWQGGSLPLAPPGKPIAHVSFLFIHLSNTYCELTMCQSLNRNSKPREKCPRAEAWELSAHRGESTRRPRSSGASVTLPWKFAVCSTVSLIWVFGQMSEVAHLICLPSTSAHCLARASM